MINFLLTSDTHYGYSKNTHKLHERFLLQLQKEITFHDVKCLIHSGDWACNKQDQFERTMIMFRKYIDIPIVAVRGNHELWDYRKDKFDPMKGEMVRGRKMSWEVMDEKHKQWFKENNIHHLESGGPMVIDDVIICGFDGWYYHMNAPTNDGDMIVSHVGGATSMMYHSKRAYEALDKVLQVDTDPYRKAICVTHHTLWVDNPHYASMTGNPSFLPHIKEKFDVLTTGHSHQYRNDTEDETLILNCGSGYDKPKYIVFGV